MNGDTLLVKMAEIAVTTDSQCLKTTLGSCVGVVLHDPVRRVSGMAHIMLPNKLEGDTKIGKFADTAIPYMLTELLGKGCRRAGLEVYIAGGGNMFKSSGDTHLNLIGDKNVREVKRILEDLRIPLRFEDTGGTCGRTMMFDNRTGQVTIKKLKSPTEIRR
jgi:chemotaxis protein CheD